MTQSKRLLSKRGNIRFERVIDIAGKVRGYLVNGVRYDSYAEARRQFRDLTDHYLNVSIKLLGKRRTIAPSPDDTTSSRSGSS